MDEGTIRQLSQLRALEAEMHAVVANIEGMKADNTIRENCEEGLAWNGGCFFDAQRALEELAGRMREEI